MTEENTPAVLLLEDGTAYQGHAYGAQGTTLGEAVFATGMTGYQETLTDPSYAGQIIAQTAPHIGNTGVNQFDAESRRIWAAGYVVRDPARRASNWRSERGLEEELIDQNIVGIQGIDTRALTRRLREHGAMRAGIFSGDAWHQDEAKLLKQVTDSAPMAGAQLAESVSVAEAYTVEPADCGWDSEVKHTIAVLDLGLKAMTPRRFAERGVRVRVLPATSSWEQVRTAGHDGGAPDGVFISNGPGDPATADQQVELLRSVLTERIPFFGICFGNQILGRALGFGTYKLPYGHRGINQPVLDRATGTVEITSQNHGFAVDAPIDTDTEAPHAGFGKVRVSHVSLNDDVVEGLACLDLPAFSVQYHPEAAAGPHDSAYLFDRFIALMEDHAAKDGK